MAITLLDIIGTITGKLAFERAQANFTTLKTEVNSHGEQINTLDALVGLGGIKESGSNTNGSYVKFEDGTMLCYFKAVSSVITSEVAGNVFVSANATWLFAATFLAAPFVVITAESVTGGHAIGGRPSGITMSGASYRLIGTAVATELKMQGMAIGRWKA